MSILADLVVQIGVDGAGAAKSALTSVENGIHATGQAAERAGRSLTGNLAYGLRNAGQAALYAGGALGAFAVAASAKGLFDEGVQFDSLTRGLQAVTGSSAETQKELVSLREVAKLPGLGLQEAIQGSINLQAAGLSADLAKRSLEAFGNALATVGKGKADLDGVTLALTQIQAKGKVMGQDVLQLQERVPQIRQAMQAAFGTSDTEQLQKMGIDATTFINGVVVQLAKLPQVTGGAGNALENLGDKIKLTFLPVASGLARMFETLEPAIEGLLDRMAPFIARVSDVFNRVANSGVLADAFNMAADGVGRLLGQFGGDTGTDAITQFVARTLSAIATFPTVLSEAGQNVANVFNVLKNDAGEIFRFLVEKSAAAANALGIAFAVRIDQIRGDLATIPDAIQALLIAPSIAIGAINATKILKSRAGLDMDAIKGAETGPMAAFRNVAAPDLKGFGGMTPLTDLFGKSGDFAKKIAAASAAGAVLPDTGKAISPAMQALTKQSDYLERIESNTAKSADALTLRRQSYGGAALAQLGVTPAELAGGGAGGGGGFQHGGHTFIEFSTAPAANELDRAIRKMVEGLMSQIQSPSYRPRSV